MKAYSFLAVALSFFGTIILSAKTGPHSFNRVSGESPLSLSDLCQKDGTCVRPGQIETYGKEDEKSSTVPNIPLKLGAGKKRVLYLLTADWCIHCIALKEDLNDPNVKKAMSDVEVITVDVDAYPDAWDVFHVSKIPAMLLFESDQAAREYFKNSKNAPKQRIGRPIAAGADDGLESHADMKVLSTFFKK